MPIVISGATFNGGFNIQGPMAPAAAPSAGSVLFNSTPSQYLSIPNNAAFTQNQAFTIECWYFPTSINTGYVWSMLQSGFFTLKWMGGQFVIDVSYVGNPTGYAPIGRTYSINNWYHLALSWDGTTGWLFVNGVIEATFTGAGGDVSAGNPFYIGQYQGQGQPTPQGYISNFRVVKGAAVYTNTFTPPRSPLTAISGTQLLLNTTNDANFLKDNSTNNFTVTNNGSVTSSSFNPLTTGSLVFNGTSQYLNTPSSSAFAFGTSDFTMETWIYPNSLSGRLWFFSSNTDNVDLNSSGGIFYFGSGGIYNSATNTVITVGTWHHIALVRSSGTITLYVNGVSVMSQSGIGYNSSSNRSIDIAYSASQGNGYFNGRMSNFRIIKGTALYTGSTITVPTTPLSAVNNTQLLLNTTNDANFLKDGSTNNFTITNNGSVTSTSLNPF